MGYECKASKGYVTHGSGRQGTLRGFSLGRAQGQPACIRTPIACSSSDDPGYRTDIWRAHTPMRRIIGSLFCLQGCCLRVLDIEVTIQNAWVCRKILRVCSLASIDCNQQRIY